MGVERLWTGTQYQQKPTERITREGILGTSRNLGFFPKKGSVGIYSTESLLFVPGHYPKVKVTLNFFLFFNRKCCGVGAARGARLGALAKFWKVVR